VRLLAVGVKYWDKESWISYMKNDILPLYESILSILNLWGRLKEIAHGKFLSEVVKEMPSMELVFAAGTSPPDKYEGEGLALVYKSLLGAYIKLREYYFLKSLGKEPKTTCTVEKTGVINYLDRIFVLLERVLARACELELITKEELQSVQENSRRIVQEILAKPESISERFAELLNKALKLTANYNEYTRFIWHLRKIPKKYMAGLYSELPKSETFKLIQEILGLREYIVPQVEDPEIVDMYTIFSFDYATRVDERFLSIEYGFSPTSTYEPYGTIGGCLCRINELIWELFTNPSIRSCLALVVSEVPDPFVEWQKEAVSGPPTYSYLDRLNSYENLSFLDEVLPAIFTGRAELVKDSYGSLFIRRRW